MCACMPFSLSKCHTLLAELIINRPFFSLCGWTRTWQKPEIITEALSTVARPDTIPRWWWQMATTRVPWTDKVLNERSEREGEEKNFDRPLPPPSSPTCWGVLQEKKDEFRMAPSFSLFLLFFYCGTENIMVKEGGSYVAPHYPRNNGHNDHNDNNKLWRCASTKSTGMRSLQLIWI